MQSKGCFALLVADPNLKEFTCNPNEYDKHVQTCKELKKKWYQKRSVVNNKRVEGQVKKIVQMQWSSEIAN